MNLAFSFKEKIVINDAIVVSTLGGLFGAFTMNIVNYILKVFKQTEWTYAHLDASWLLYWFRVKRKTIYILGQLINASISAAMGVPIFYMLRKTGKDHYLYKGIVTGIVIWLVLYVLPSKRKMFSVKAYYPKTHFIMLLGGIIYGISTVWAIITFAGPVLFKEKR